MPQCYQSIVVRKPITKVWETIKDFHDMSWATQVIEKCEAVGDLGGTDVGAKRILNDAFHETLVECNMSDYIVRYSIDDGPSPVSINEVKNYVGKIQLKPVTSNNSTFIEWSSNWESSSDDAHDFCDQIYQALLQELAKND